MSLMSTVLLGVIAGVTILLGLPIGRLRSPAATLRALLNATAVGVLLLGLFAGFLTNAIVTVAGA